MARQRRTLNSGHPLLRLFIGAALISLSPVWVRLVDISATSSGFYRVTIGAAALALYLLMTRQRLEFGRRVWWSLVAASVFFALDLWFWHRSINYVGPGLATLLANFQVFILVIVGAVWLGQPLKPVHLVSVPLAVLGLAMIVGVDWTSLSDDYQLGVVFGLLTACAYAAYMLSLRASRRDATDAAPVREVFVISALCALMLGGVTALEGESLAIGAVDFGWMLGYGVLSHCVGWVLIASSLPRVSTTQAGLALLLQPTLSFIWDVLLFARPMLGREVLGAVVALLAIYLGSRAPSKQM
ncbi:MAG: DMT family transporter [Pseudomonadota bacterium]